MNTIGNISFKGIDKLAKTAATAPKKVAFTGDIFTKCKDTFESVMSKRAHENRRLGKILSSSADPYDDMKVWKKLSEEVHKIGEENFPEYYALLENAFKGTGAKFTGRVKEPSSVLAKLIKRQDNILLLNQNILDAVPDLYGCKLVTSGKPDEIEKVVRKIEELVDSGEVIPSHFINHGALSYLTDEQVERLARKGFSHIERIEKKAGFTGVNLYFRDKFNTSTLELQITGKKTNAANLREHLFYNFKTKGAATEHGILNEKFQSLFEKMNHDDIQAYNDYVNKCYLYSRMSEMGQKAVKPELPEGFDKALALI